MIKVGITGQIACGKTFAARFFGFLGAYVIDADKVGHQMYKLPEIKERLSGVFGREIFDDNNEVIREKLSDIVFSCEKHLCKLNEIMHPSLESFLRQKIDMLKHNSFPGVVVIDAALLGEWDLKDELDHFILIESPCWQRKKRLISERKMDPKEADRRIEAQNELNEKVKPFVNYIVRNPGEPCEFKRKLIKVWLEIKGIKSI